MASPLDRPPDKGGLMNCDGFCKPDHVGVVIRVRVMDGDKDCGECWYCEEAIAEDTRRGFKVIPFPETNKSEEKE
ncbi:MAG: hypothetical protein M0Z38_04875 [Deltaproteobacteria bacterium]|nr:hypothetical protein [Deltaproteobacteria bacterium]